MTIAVSKSSQARLKVAAKTATAVPMMVYASLKLSFETALRDVLLYFFANERLNR